MNEAAFAPGTTASLAVSAATASVQLTGGGVNVEVQNTSTVNMFVKLGTASVTAAVTDYPVLPGQSKLISRDPNTQTYIAAITASGSGTLYATPGEGV